MKNKVIIILFALICVIIAGVIIAGVIYLVRVNSNYKAEHERMRAQAILLAQTYMEENYQQEMVFVNYHYNFFEMFYTIEFSPKDNPDFIFSINANEREDKELPPEARVTLGRNDNYYRKYFEYKLEEMYKSDIEDIWGIGTECRVSLDGSIKAEQAAELNEFSPVEDAQDFLDDYYRLSIRATYNLEEDLSETALKTLNTLEILKRYECQPGMLLIWRYSKNDGRENDRRPISLQIYRSDFSEFENVSQVEEYISMIWHD